MILQNFFYVSGIVSWVVFLFSIVIVLITRLRHDIDSDMVYEDEILKRLRNDPTASKEDKKFTLTLEQYLDGEAKAMQDDE